MGFAAIDQTLLALAADTRSPALDAFFAALTILGSGWALALGSAILAGALVAVGRGSSARAVAASLFVGLLPFMQGLKMLVDRARPSLEATIVTPSSASFPSGHSFGTMLVVGLALWATRDLRGSWRWWAAAIVGLVVAALVGASRVYLGVHWPTDVLGGWILAGSWIAGTAWVATLLRAGGTPVAHNPRVHATEGLESQTPRGPGSTG